MVSIAVDGMGGDFAPQAVVRGVQHASREGLARIVLVGDAQALEPLLGGEDGVEIVHAPVSVDMDEAPSSALRRKRDSSMNRAFELLKQGEVQAVVTAGNSGAAMAFAIFTLGRFGGVERPSIATLHPNAKGGISLLLDSGGNVDCRPSQLVQFAVMGDAFARSVLGIPSPSIGVLSNGEEETKGNELTREAHAILKGMSLNYVGYAEGNDVYSGKVDVVVSDGFVGNVALKMAEGVADAVRTFLAGHVRSSILRRIGYVLMRDSFKELAKKMDYSEVGGAPLLGVDGVCIICHGKSNDRAIRSAIGQARGFVEKGLNASIKDAMDVYQTLDRAKER